MTKKLSEMSLEELWELFPIILTKHQECWSTWYRDEVNVLRNILPAQFHLRINHVGSTAINGIWAKPTIDILMEVPDVFVLNIVKEQMVTNGYICMSESRERISLNKGYSEKGFSERVFHIHLRLMGDNDEIYFRDYLNAHPQIAKEYENLKLALWKKYEHDRDKYTNAKTEFVIKYTKIAKDFLGENI